MRNLIVAAVGLFGLVACAPAQAETCRAVEHETAFYTVCSVSVDSDIRVFHSDGDGNLYGQFDALAADLEAQGLELVFAMNAGMYHSDRTPVGLYIEDAEQRAPIVLGPGPGNFGMVPNGVFSVAPDGGAAVWESETFAETAPPVAFATQSGPMLVVGGEIHPRFNPEGTSKKRRNGVGITADGKTVHFAISDVPVNFHSFARLFRDELGTPNALFLDGGVASKVYAPELERDEKGLDMGPMVGVVRQAAPQ
jgi:uncharacterized protein YigE (DUF2233 family)